MFGLGGESVQAVEIIQLHFSIKQIDFQPILKKKTFIDE